MKTNFFSIMILTSVLVVMSCSKDDVEIEIPTVLTSSGQEIILEGHWDSGCVTDIMTLSEKFTFNGNRIIIDINFSNDSDCQNVISTEVITIEYQVLGTFSTSFMGGDVVVNKISGKQTTASTGQTESFKQTFYIDDSGDKMVLYHARFEDDGGDVTSDGYPITLIPIGIHQE